MVSEHALPIQSGFFSVLVKHGILDRDTTLGRHGAYSEFSKIANDAVVMRARDAVRDKRTTAQRSGFRGFRLEKSSKTL